MCKIDPCTSRNPDQKDQREYNIGGLVMFSANQLCFSTVVNNETVHVPSLTLGQHICFDPPGLRLAADVLAGNKFVL